MTLQNNSHKRVRIEIDNRSGFCFGVARAIKTAEDLMSDHQSIVTLGDIVHNSEEIARLEKKGMKTAGHEQIPDLKNKTVLFRAHGEPPSTYETLNKLGANIVDATCPVVLKLQERIRKAWVEMKEKNGQIVIYGKKGHPEVTGLAGQTLNEAIIVTIPDDIAQIDSARPVVLFSQTTMSYKGFESIRDAIRIHLNHQVEFRFHNSICAQVGNRAPHLRTFAASYDVVVFVGGVKSSNAKVLYETCKEANPASYFTPSVELIQPEWFPKNIQSVGICGATSTPQWLMEAVAEKVDEMVNN